jgi:hypothetical protein
MIIEKKQGIINEIIYNNTVYHNQQYIYCPTIINLEYIIKQIIKTNSTTEYVRFNPFYRSYKTNTQIEFDSHMFYIECRNNFTKEEQEEHISDSSDKLYADMTDEERKEGHILYPLCKNGDYENFNQCLMSFQKYLDILIPKLFQEAINKLQLKEEDIPFGYFCFEVDSE